jgi:hypothetical protein
MRNYRWRIRKIVLPIYRFYPYTFVFAWVVREEIPLGLISKSLSEPVTGKTSLVQQCQKLAGVYTQYAVSSDTDLPDKLSRRILSQEHEGHPARRNL